MLGSVSLRFSQKSIIFEPIMGEQNAEVVLYFLIESNKLHAFAFAGFLGFILGITDVTPSAGLKREKTGKVTRSISPSIIPNVSFRT
jgi:hypothetical protein